MEQPTPERPQPERDEQAEKLVGFLHKIKAEQVFNSEENKLAFIKNLTFEGFKDWLERINGVLRGKPIADRGIDGDSMVISSQILGVDHVFPLVKDKDGLLKKTFESLQETENIQDVALLLSTAITAIHPFIDGNGRMSRLAFVLFNQNYEATSEQDEKLKTILGEEGRLKLNTSSVLLDYYVGIELYQEVGLNIEDPSLPKNLFPKWREIKSQDTNLTDEDFKTLFSMESDSFDQFIAVYKYLKNKGVLEKYTRSIYRGEELVRTIIDLKKLTPDLTSEDVQEISKTYWELKKERIEKMIDALTSPEQHLLPDTEKQKDEKHKDITLKERFKKEVLSTMSI